MKTSILKLKRSFIRQLIGFFSLTTLVFVFEACYGTPQDFGDDVEISGHVLSSADGQAIEGIKVQIQNNNYYVVTGTDGSFSIFTSPGQDYYLTFSDNNPDQYGNFVGKDTLLKLGLDSLNNIEIRLDEYPVQ